MARSLAPPPVRAGGRTVVAPAVERVEATLTFDVAAREGAGSATIDFSAGATEGCPALDLRQPVEWLRLDGRGLHPDCFAPTDVGAGPQAALRVLDVSLPAGSRHRLQVGYRLGTPTAEGAEPVGWVDGGVRFDFWMSDLHPGRYLEMWVPAPLVHDRFALQLDLVLEGAQRPHTVIANTAGVNRGPGPYRWRLLYPAAYTALSPLLVLSPADSIEVRRRPLALPGRDRSLSLVTVRHRDTDADLAACEADIAAWLSHLAVRYPPWAHGDTYSAVVWSLGRGMEYDAATTASVAALEHEVFHSWFGRGVKPARAADGWIDEAYTTWSTASRRSEPPRFACFELGLDADPSVLYPPHPWSRYTPVEAYTRGAELFAGLAHLFGGADRLRQAMADWYRGHAGALVTTDGLRAHLSCWSGLDLAPWWDRYVYGRG
jgi:hypothetical protein